MSETKEEILNSHLAYGKDTYLAGSEEAILKAMDAWADQKLEEYKERLKKELDHIRVPMPKGYVLDLIKRT